MRISDKIIKWFEQRKGKVTYSMERRTGPNSYDCSSAVYYAVCEALGLEVGYPVSTETEHEFLLKNGFEKIADNSEWSAKRGDVFILGRKGYSAGAGGHTGVFVDKDHIIHCNYDKNGISIDKDTILPYDKMGWYAYRLKDDKEETISTSNINEVRLRKLVVTDRAIDNLPHFCEDRNNVGNTVDFIGFVVTLTKKWENYYYSQYLNGWIHSSAFEDIITCNFKVKVKNKGYSVDNLPWTKRDNKWYKHVTSSDELIGKEFTITARTTKTGGYCYIHELAKWIDNRAF
ncbi:MAG: NlpC/P60 family protein [Parvimonas sp.]|uniref:peptidoglycan amidohydrolase family protein n=1 Tax=Parvimonas sp. TaxID=1944660 RepID=UPI0025D75715|nr:peptidoglycan amidohydrolase family protein [Parvimonas sp.]MCI5997007.1 NlpC/P60 family protein [Parvimonas sp.]